MDEQERAFELARLQTTIQEIKDQIAESADNCDDQRAELNNTLKDYWSNTGGNVHDEAQFIETVGRQKAISAIVHQGYRQLQKMLNSPYFGRIDFAEKTNGCYEPFEQIYIGISSLSQQDTGDFLVYDWRTPVASMYYDFERGDAWYASLDGKIKGIINLKRQYKIVDGVMQHMFDADIQIQDEILQEILGKSVDDKMHTIVTSIQREQNQVIRDDQHRVLFVQGPAGSGKTSIALHRIAFLLYRDRQSITSQNVLILSPNHIFSDYISNVLPEMGEENVLQLTFQDYVLRSTEHLSIQFQDRASHLESILSNYHDDEKNTKKSSVQFKSSANFEKALEKFVDNVEKNLVRDYPAIEVNGEPIFTKADWNYYYYDSLAYLPPIRRLAKIRELIQIRMRPFVHALRQKKEDEITAAAEEVNKKTIKILARVEAKKELDPLVSKIAKLSELSSISLYRKFWKDEKFFKQYLADIVTEDCFRKIRKKTLSDLSNNMVAYEDSFPLLYLLGKLEGFQVRYDVKHLVIDEAQDYTSLQYKILANIFPNCSWTIVGDPVQSVHPYLKTADFQTASQIINISNPHFFKLTRSYRSTPEIMAFCQAMLPETTQVETINRPGKLPQLIKVLKPNLLIAVIRDTILALQADNLKSIGIICKTAQEAYALYQQLGEEGNISLVTKEDDAFHRGIVIIPAYLAKGLEFDAVLAINIDNKTYHDKREINILYTICTRALHRLCLIYTGTPSPFISEIEKDLFIISK